MKVIQSPEKDTSERAVFGKKLFLAGGISNCPDWQSYLSEKFLGVADTLHDVTIYNPRRTGGLCKDGKDAYIQILWENYHLKLTSYFLFWFPEETVCPITLFELGKYAYQMSMFDYPHLNFFVGMHPNYSRRFDVETQISLMMPDIKFDYSLDALFDRAVYNLSNPLELRYKK